MCNVKPQILLELSCWGSVRNRLSFSKHTSVESKSNCFLVLTQYGHQLHHCFFQFCENYEAPFLSCNLIWPDHDNILGFFDFCLNLIDFQFQVLTCKLRIESFIWVFCVVESWLLLIEVMQEDLQWILFQYFFACFACEDCLNQQVEGQVVDVSFLDIALIDPIV